METSDTYRLGRLVLSPGESFRASGGPFYRSADGTCMSMAEEGPFKFVRFCRKDERHLTITSQ